MFRRHVLFGALAALLGGSAAAASLDDLRTTLEKVGPPQAVRVRVEIRSTTVGKNKREEKVCSPIILEHGPEGLRLTWDSAQIKRAQEASRPHSPEQRETSELAELSASDALELVDGAQSLRRMLAGATLLSEKEGTFAGRPARVLVVRPTNEMTEETRKQFKTFEETLTITLGSDGLPRLTEHAVDVKISKLLVSMSSSMRETKRYTSVAGRLLVTASEESSSSTALGQSGEQRRVLTVVPF